VCTHGGFVFGNNHFQQQVAAMLGRCTWKDSPGRKNRLLISLSKRFRFRASHRQN